MQNAFNDWEKCTKLVNQHLKDNYLSESTKDAFQIIHIDTQAKFISEMADVKNTNESRYCINETLKKHEIVPDDIDMTLKKIDV